MTNFQFQTKGVKMHARDELTICTEIRDLLFPYFKPEFKKMYYHLIYINNFSRYGIRVVLNDDKIQCFSNHFINNPLLEEKSSKDKYKIYNLFKELKPIIVAKYGYWSSCYFYVNKDGTYELDLNCNRDGNEDVEENLPTFVQEKIDEVNKGKNQ